MRARYLLLTVGAVSLVAPASLLGSLDAGREGRAASCGVERWAVKTLTDPAARTVSLTPKATTVRALRRLPAPVGVRGRPRIPGVETTTYRVRASLVEMKLEDDEDIHLVIAEPGRPRLTMIVEFPSPGCTVGAPAAARARMARARRAVVAACGEPSESSFTRLQGVATITGVGFFDVIHGQRGVAPNGIELHPVLGFTQAACKASPAPGPPPPTTTTPPPPTTTKGRNCHPSYPTVCIPPPPPDLDCSDIPYRNFPVRHDVPDPDPHRFDGNKDGVGCEK